MDTLSQFLSSKKIDPEAFRLAFPDEWERFHQDFCVLSVQAFEMQKKFFLNSLRRQFPLKE